MKNPNCKLHLRIALYCLMSLYATTTWSQVSSSKFTKETILEVRKGLDDSAKNYCVSFWTETETKKQTLYKNGITLSGQCSCTQQEVSYLMNDDLAVNAYIGFDDLEKGKPVSPALQQWHKLVFNSMQMCSEKLMRRR